MRDMSSSIFVRARAAFAFIAESLGKFVGLNDAGFAAQRMCPSCGLITPRSKALCLECGKPL